MPRVLQKAERSLKELCLNNIIAHTDSLWYKDFLDKYFGTTHFMYILGAFDDLPHKLIGLWQYALLDYVISPKCPHYFLKMDNLQLAREE